MKELAGLLRHSNTHVGSAWISLSLKLADRSSIVQPRTQMTQSLVSRAAGEADALHAVKGRHSRNVATRQPAMRAPRA